MEKPIPAGAEETRDLAPLTVIRTETALSRFPIHRIAKKGTVRIELKHQAKALLWKVSYNSEYGQPGPLAYQLDTLVVNRRIEEAGRPIPPLIRLGSLRDIAEEVGAGKKNTSTVKRALLQNASTFINAKITYRRRDHSEHSLEAAFTRYSVIFTGEVLPDGNVADAVYLVLNQPYREVLESALSRPLDYAYMKALPAGAQRFYEIVSYQIYGALHHQNERAKLRYSEYCMLSTATRYFDFDHVKKQMWKIHRYHLASGYLAKVNYEQTTDAEGQPDWWMYYVPGPNASREYREFTGSVRGGQRGKRRISTEGSAYESRLLPLPPVESPTALDPLPQDTKETSSLVTALVAAHLNRKDAVRLAQENPEECRRQLAYLPFKADLKKPGGWLLSAIQGKFDPPDAYIEAQEKAERERKLREEQQRQVAVEAAKRAAEAAQDAATDKEMVRLEIQAPAAFLQFVAYTEEQWKQAEVKYARMPATIHARMAHEWRSEEKRRELFRQWKGLNPSIPLATSDPATVRSLVQASLKQRANE